MFMKLCHDSSDDDKFPVASNETFSENTAVFMQVLLMHLMGSEYLQIPAKRKPFTAGRRLFSGCAVGQRTQHERFLHRTLFYVSFILLCSWLFTAKTFVKSL